MAKTIGRRVPAGLLAVVLLAGVLGVYLWRSGPGRGREDVVIRGFAMDTVVAIRVPAGHEPAARQALAELNRLERIFDRHDPASEVARVNAGAGDWVAVGPEVMEVLALVEDMAAVTGGLFDVTVGPLLELWGFGGETARVPGPAELARALDLVGGRLVELDRAGGRVRLARQGMVIDLGGVAKGYAIDRAARVLRDRGVDYGLVEVGGDIYLFGGRSGDRPWRVGVEHPRHGGEMLGRIHLWEGAVATSGDYQRFFMEGGERYHHILDPRTGRPGRQAQLATVVGPSVAEVDILSTALFLMGPEWGLEVLEGLPGIEGIIVDKDGGVRVSSGLRDRPEPFFED
ncbi:MAG: FAD:protein FMN transferase [bacterium]|nr:FAD:protein FMN transferase [bacterium]